MDTNTSQNRLSEYCSIMMQREGLSFSDYFDDSVPYEVKPVPSTIPMQEEKEEDWMSEDYKIDYCWLDKSGKIVGGDGTSHFGIAKTYLKSQGIDVSIDDTYSQMFNLGFIRVYPNNFEAVLHIEYYPPHIPTNSQMRFLKDYCIIHKYSLMDDNGHKTIDLNESLIKENTLTSESESDYIGHSDVPTQSKDLFKGLWEDVVENHRDYWMDSKGKLLKAKAGHFDWAINYLNAHKIPYNTDFDGIERSPDDVSVILFKLGFLRIKVHGNKIFVNYLYEKPPSNYQWRILRDLAIESDMKLINASSNNLLGKDVELSESKYVNKGHRQLFIEHMMPDNMDTFKLHLTQLFSYLQKELQLKTVPKVKLLSDEKNADKVLGKTAYYDPDTRTVNLYIINRHQKDILRSFAHEIIHHWQHENGRLQTGDKKGEGASDPQYAQKNPWLRQMEKQAYLLGNLCFRDWEDEKKAKDKKNNIKMTEKTYLLGKEYPQKKIDYSG